MSSGTRYQAVAADQVADVTFEIQGTVELWQYALNRTYDEIKTMYLRIRTFQK